MSRLFSLFDERLKDPNELISGPRQTLEDVGSAVDDPETILRKIKQFEISRPKIDYSDFSNFVFFNSALDYFNVSGEKIINEYPYDGTSEQIQLFVDALDDYQRYLISVWPRTSGHLRFDPSISSSFVKVEDSGKDTDGVSRTGLLNIGTGSFSLEAWVVNPPALTGSDDVMVLAQKLSGSNGYTVFFSGSHIYAQVQSGSSTDSLSTAFDPGELAYYCFSYDRGSTNTFTIFTGSREEFPVSAASAVPAISENISAGVVPFTIASGSVASKTVRPFSGSLDEVRFWSTGRSLSDLTGSFNVRVDAIDGMTGLWRFNETSSLDTNSRDATTTLDHSGRKLHGNIYGYFWQMRSSASLLPHDATDIVRSLNSSDVVSFVEDKQNSGSQYDRDNDNLITRLYPEQSFILEDFKQTSVLKNFLYVMARQFDQIKCSIDQFRHVLSVNYGDFNQTPDALLQDVARFFGWEFTGNFLNADAIQYIVGKDVLQNTDSNKSLDMKLYEIKNEFWKRTLINLMHIYKSKGTRESVESLLRVYGLNRSFVRLKEYGTKPFAGIQTYRINAEKSVPAIGFGSGSANTYVRSNSYSGRSLAVESRVRFPTSLTTEITSSYATGSIWSINSGSASRMSLSYMKDSVSSLTGDLVFSSSDGTVTLSDLPIFDNRWINVAVNRDYVSSSLGIDVRILDTDDVVLHRSSSLFTTFSTASFQQTFWLGSTGSLPTEAWIQEARVWNEPLSDVEMRDHTLNYQSYGTEEVDGAPALLLHWRLNENLTASAGNIPIQDFSGMGVSGTGSIFTTGLNPYKKFLNDYNFIASPEYGWNEEKIRSLPRSSVLVTDAFRENPLVALEFNLVDALNEDISQIISTLDGFNESIGAPVNRFRESYPDLETLRKNYFKRLQGSINFRVFADALEFFDRSFIEMVRRLIPARAKFLGDEFVIESHMLERPKLQWNYTRKEQEIRPLGVISVYRRR